MPRQSGIEVVRHIRNVSPGLPVVFLTGYEMKADNAEFISQNNLILLKKPFPLVKLKQIVAECTRPRHGN